MLNARFNNMSAIFWRLVLLVDETTLPARNDEPSASHRRTRHTMLSLWFYRDALNTNYHPIMGIRSLRMEHPFLLTVLWKEIWNRDGQTFYQYQENEQLFPTSNHWIQNKTMTFAYGNPWPGLWPAKRCIYLDNRRLQALVGTNYNRRTLVLILKLNVSLWTC